LYIFDKMSSRAVLWTPWLSGSNVMIAGNAGPFPLSSKKLKFSSWQNGVWPIGICH